MNGNDPVIEALKTQIGELHDELRELRQDLYSDEKRRRVGALERQEQMVKRLDDHEVLLEAFQRREQEREQRETKRGRVVNSLLAIITTILVGFMVAGLNQFFWGV